MKKEDKLSRIIKQKLEQESPGYDPAYWEEAMAHMQAWDQQGRKKRKPLFWLLISGLFLLLLTASGALLWGEYGGNNSDQNLTSLPVIISQDSCSKENNTLLGSFSVISPTVASKASKITAIDERVMPSEIQNSTTERALDASFDSQVAETTTQDVSLHPLVERKDSLYTAISQNSPDPLEVTPEYPSRISWTLELSKGISDLNFSYDEGQGYDLSRDLRLGLGIQIPLRKRQYLQTGLSYASIPLEEGRFEVSGRTFGFSFTEETLSWNPSRADILQLPLRWGFYLRPAHRLEGGLAINYLLGSRGNYTLTSSDGFGNESQRSGSLSGITYGMNRIGLGVHLAYKFQLFTRLQGGIEYQQDLSTFAKREVYGNEMASPYRGLRFNLYYIIR